MLPELRAKKIQPKSIYIEQQNRKMATTTMVMVNHPENRVRKKEEKNHTFKNIDEQRNEKLFFCCEEKTPKNTKIEWSNKRERDKVE